MTKLGWTNEQRLEKRANVRVALIVANMMEKLEVIYGDYTEDTIVYDVDSVGTMCDEELKAWGQFCRVHNLPY